MIKSRVLTIAAAVLCLTGHAASVASSDFDGDGRDDIGCYYAPGGNWYVFQSTEGFRQTQFGYAGTVPVVGDFDGDGRDDIGCYYAPGGNWYLFQSTNGFWETQFGYAGTVPVVGDFDGDGRDDIGCYHAPSGNWYLFQSTEGFRQTQFGYAGTVPVVGDFDGDGRDDIGCYYAPGGNWYVFQSTDGFRETQFGYAGTVPVVGDFDGDGRDDIGCYYAPGGNWYVFQSTDGFRQMQFGYAGTVPVVGDFDGDDRDDIGCYFAPGGNWYVFQSTDGFWQTQFGYAGTVPVASGGPWANVIVQADLPEGGQVTGSGIYLSGAQVLVTATPNPGWLFQGWSDGVMSPARTVQADISSTVLTARFVRDPTVIRVVEDEYLRDGAENALNTSGTQEAADFVAATIAVGDTFVPLSGSQFTVTDLDVYDVAAQTWLVGDGEGPSNYTTLYFYRNSSTSPSLIIYLGM